MSDKKFTGVWIPANVLQDTGLTWTEKILIGYTMSFPGRCFASDEHMAATLGMARKTVANILSSLRRKGYLTGRNFPKSGKTDFPKTGTGLPAFGNGLPQDGNIDISGEESEKMKKIPGGFDHGIPEALKQEVIVSLTAERGFPSSDVRAALDLVIREVRAGLTKLPSHWPAYLAGRIRLEAKRAKAAQHHAPNANESRFAVCH